MLPSALLFDMDGTLTDTEALWLEAEISTLEAFGSQWDADATKDIIGMSLVDASQHLIDSRDLDIKAEDLADLLVTRVVELGRRNGMPWRPGALRLLELSAELGIPSALVTSSYLPFAELTLEQAPPGTLTEVVTGDQLTKGKPHPEAYLTAAARLEVPIHTCIAFEDSEPGLRSAHASGAVPVAIPFQVELPVLEGVRVIRSLEDVDASELHRMMTGEGYL